MFFYYHPGDDSPLTFNTATGIVNEGYVHSKMK